MVLVHLLGDVCLPKFAARDYRRRKIIVVIICTSTLYWRYIHDFSWKLQNWSFGVNVQTSFFSLGANTIESLSQAAEGKGDEQSSCSESSPLHAFFLLKLSPIFVSMRDAYGNVINSVASSLHVLAVVSSKHSFTCYKIFYPLHYGFFDFLASWNFGWKSHTCLLSSLFWLSHSSLLQRLFLFFWGSYSSSDTHSVWLFGSSRSMTPLLWPRWLIESGHMAQA